MLSNQLLDWFVGFLYLLTLIFFVGLILFIFLFAFYDWQDNKVSVWQSLKNTLGFIPVIIPMVIYLEFILMLLFCSIWILLLSIISFWSIV